MLAKEEGVARAVGDAGDLDAAVVADHAVEKAEDRRCHQVRVPEGKCPRIPGIACERLEPVAGRQGENGIGSPAGDQIEAPAGRDARRGGTGRRNRDCVVLNVAGADQRGDPHTADRQAVDVG